MKFYSNQVCGPLPGMRFKIDRVIKPATVKLIIMQTKLIVLLLITGFMQVSANSYAQKITLNRKNTSLEQVFREIRKQSGYNVLCDADILKNARRLDLSLENASLETVLNACFSGRNIEYAVDNQTIIIKQGNITSKFWQQLMVKGQVKNENGEPMPGVSVRIKSGTVSAITDATGNFSIAVLNDEDKLIFSYVGYESQEVPVNGRPLINITLKSQTSALDQVVVVGYGTQKKSDVNAAIVSINPDRIDKTAQPSIDQMLQGQAAGLSITNSSQPGGGTVVNIRGATSTGAGNGPLVVIDGFPVIYDAVEPGSGNKYNLGSRGALNDINPNDIASIEILKDASATAIYGARGSNGVILITTKRGKVGSEVTYSVNTSVQDLVNKPELLNAKEYLIEQNSYLYELYLQQNKLVPYGTNNPATAPAYIPRNSQSAIDAAGIGTDWYDKITQQGTINQHNLTINRGTENLKALFSFNYFDQEGVVKGSGLDRYSFRMNLDQKITKWWDIGTSLTGSIIKSKNSQLGNGRDADAGIMESALNYNPLTPAQRDPLTGKWVEDPNQPLLGNPLSFLEITDNTNNQRLLANVFTNVYFTNEIWLKLNLGTDTRNGLRQSYYPKTSRYGSQVNGEANINRAQRNDYVADLTLNFNKTLHEDHNIQGVAGYSYQLYKGNGSGSRAQNFSSDALLYDDLGAGSQRPVVSSYRDRHILASYFTRLQYGFKNRYLFTFTGRVDGSDRFGANNRYAFFPSAAFAWRAIEESFLQNNNTISDLKLRLSAGQVGNENISNSAASEYYGFNGRDYYFNGNMNTGVSLSKIGNPNLKWETTTAYNIGLDFGFFKNRISGSVDAYYKKVDDLLSNRTLPQSSIVGSIPWNVGSTQGKGLEVMLNTVNLTGPFKWSSLFTFTSYRDNWKNRDPKVMLQPYQGGTDPLTAVFTLLPDGIKQAGEATPAMPGLLPGQQKYKDINGLDANGNLTGIPDGKINQADVVYLGNRAPKYAIGFNNDFSYKGFDLNFFIYASVGGLKWAATRLEHSVYGSYGTQRFKDNFNFLKEVQNRWTSKNTDTDIPSGEVNSYDGYGSPYWEKSSYLRLKTVSVGYDLSQQLIKRDWLKSARLFIGAQNLFTLTNYNGLDPEAENDRALYPQQRTISLGLDVKF
jgi:TonB-linked SusC/RagA family outer membrane protein